MSSEQSGLKSTVAKLMLFARPPMTDAGWAENE